MLFESGLSRKLQNMVKYYGKSESFGKKFRWTKFDAVERVKKLLNE